jgi:hypothetical protein
VWVSASVRREARSHRQPDVTLDVVLQVAYAGDIRPRPVLRARTESMPQIRQGPTILPVNESL